MRAKEFIPASKPRNFVAKNQQTGGAGAHRDKKKEQKQGYEKHKGRGVSEGLTTEKQILTRIRQIMHDRKLSGTESNAGELHRLKQQLKDLRSQQGVSEGIDIGQEWMTDTELDQYVPDDLQQEWRELVGYDEAGNAHPLWANITGDYEPDVSDPEHRAWMVKVANKWFAMKRIPNVRFFAVRDRDDELEWLVQIGDQGVAESDEDPSEEEMDRTVSDLHKDVFGIRPSPEWGREWMSMSEQEKRDLYYQMVDMLDQQQDMSEGYGNKEFEVDGYTYMTDLDREEDNQKIWHMIKTPDGKTVNVDFTPYAYMTKDDVELYVKLGMPKRQGRGPLDSKQLQKMAQIKGVAMLDPKMARAGM